MPACSIIDTPCFCSTVRKAILRAYEPFHWLEPGWSKAFRKVPEVHWLPGSHGQFFLKENVSFLAERVRVFLNGNE